MSDTVQIKYFSFVERGKESYGSSRESCVEFLEHRKCSLLFKNRKAVIELFIQFKVVLFVRNQFLWWNKSFLQLLWFSKLGIVTFFRCWISSSGWCWFVKNSCFHRNFVHYDQINVLLTTYMFWSITLIIILHQSPT